MRQASLSSRLYRIGSYTLSSKSYSPASATWFLPTKQEDADNGTVVDRVPSRPFRKRLTETYGELLQAVLAEVCMADAERNKPFATALTVRCVAWPSCCELLDPRIQFVAVLHNLLYDPSVSFGSTPKAVVIHVN